MRKGFKNNYFLLVVALSSGIFSASLSPARVAFAQNNQQQIVEAQKAKLQAELDQLEKEIAEKQKILDGQQQKSASIERDVSILSAKIDKAKLDIKAKNIAIEKLGQEIVKKNETIGELTSKIDREKQSLAQLIRKTNEIDQSTIVHVILSSKSLSEFYSDLDSFDSIKQSVKNSVNEIKGVKTETEAEKQDLKKKQDAETDAKVAIEANKRNVEKNETEKKTLLSISKNKEKEYQQILADRAKKAAQIRSALFGLRDTAAIPFGDALTYAVEVQKKTGVRPAFLLAILTQETNLGENVGQCLMTNLATGSGIGKNTGRPFSNIMKPGRDIPPFLLLADALGFDPKTKPVSCPQAGGYGGAMGPSQFIASTWAGLTKRIAAASGTRIPDPWIPRDAFYASAIFLSDLGASGGGYSAEYEAAARYYAGSYWRTRGSGYAASVMKHAQDIQENMIDPLNI